MQTPQNYNLQTELESALFFKLEHFTYVARLKM